MSTSYMYRPESFDTYADVINDIIRCAPADTKEYFAKRGVINSLPESLKFLNFYCITKNILNYMPLHEKITRSTSVPYYLSTITRKTDAVTDDTPSYATPFGVSKSITDTLNPKDIFGLHVIYVVGQIQDTFEHYIPDWATGCGATENLGISLALKLTPKHRIRVYQRNDHIIIFTTKGFEDLNGTEYELYRRIWACIPLLRGWTDTPESTEDYQEIINLFKALIKSNAAEFWLLLTAAYNNSPEIKDLKYSTIIQTFNNIKAKRLDIYMRKATDCALSAERYLAEYARALEQQREANRFILEIQENDTGLDTDVIKQLVDKKICYALNIGRLNDGDGTISYRVSAPLLSYDKDAALVCFNKRIKTSNNPKLIALFKLLFIDEKVVLNFDEAIDIKLNRGTIHAKHSTTHIYTDLHATFPNPHHFYFNCWGSYGIVISKLIHNYKLEELFYQIKAAVGSLNFTDYPVLSYFVQHLSNIAEDIYHPHCFLWVDEGCTTLHTLQETLNHFTEEETN